MLTFIIITTIIQLYIVVMSLRKRDLYKNKHHKNKVLFIIIGTLGIPIVPLLFIQSEYWTLKWTKYPTEIEIYKLILEKLKINYVNNNYSAGICHMFPLIKCEESSIYSNYSEHINKYRLKFKVTQQPSKKNNFEFYDSEFNSPYGYWFKLSKEGLSQRIAFVKHIINKLENESNITKN